MNKLQELFAGITGFDVENGHGARDCYYFEDCKTREEKIKYLSDCCTNNDELDISLSELEIFLVYEAIEKYERAKNTLEYDYNMRLSYYSLDDESVAA